MSELPEFLRVPEKGKKTVYIENTKIWYDKEKDCINLVVNHKDGLFVAITNDPNKVNGHPILFENLSRFLEMADAQPRPNPSLTKFLRK